MRRPLHGWLPTPHVHGPYQWVAWQDTDIDRHASVKYLSFQGTLDAKVFGNLGSLTGCRLLMRAIRDCDEFCPAGTWLITESDTGTAIATIQATLDESGIGRIQNVGVVPERRGLGLGVALLAQCLHGLRAVGARQVTLEVTSGNPDAMRLYHRAGFRPYNTYYRELDRRPPLGIPVGAESGQRDSGVERIDSASHL
jgi:ribosomal protein S18 acetylase RimI-like enzyme